MVIAGIGLIVLARNWPFTQQAVTTALEGRFARTVRIRSFHKTYLPPGCVAEGISFLHRQRQNLPPLITVQTLVIRGSYNGLFRIHKRVDEVQVKGLHVLIAQPDLTAGFGVGGGRFTDSNVQQQINTLTQSAHGENKKQEAEDPETVLSDLKGQVSVKNGVATLSNVFFSAPGTLAQIQGTYNLVDQKVDLHGVLHTNGKLSDNTSDSKHWC